MHREAETRGQLVQDDTCAACPLRVLMESKQQKQGSASLPVVQPGVFPPCEYRAGGHCMVTRLSVTEDTCNRCVRESATEEAGLVEKFHNYRQAIRKWVAAGRPVRSAERVAEIHDNHCVGCAKYDPVKKACLSCGCLVNKGSVPLTNKLKMATEACPLGQFPEEVSV